MGGSPEGWDEGPHSLGRDQSCSRGHSRRPRGSGCDPSWKWGWNVSRGSARARHRLPQRPFLSQTRAPPRRPWERRTCGPTTQMSFLIQWGDGFLRPRAVLWGLLASTSSCHPHPRLGWVGGAETLPLLDTPAGALPWNCPLRSDGPEGSSGCYLSQD